MVERTLSEAYPSQKVNPVQTIPETQPVGPPSSRFVANDRRPRRNRNVNNDDKKWKEEITKQCSELQVARQVAEGQAQKPNAENDALNKEIGRLRHLTQLRSGPTWVPTSANGQTQSNTQNAQSSVRPQFVC